VDTGYLAQWSLYYAANEFYGEVLALYEGGATQEGSLAYHSFIIVNMQSKLSLSVPRMLCNDFHVLPCTIWATLPFAATQIAQKFKDIIVW